MNTDIDWIAVGAIGTWLMAFGTLAMAFAVFITLKTAAENRRKDRCLRDIDDIIDWAELVTNFISDVHEGRSSEALSIVSAFAPISARYISVLNAAKQLRNKDLVTHIAGTYESAAVYKQMLLHITFEKNVQKNTNAAMALLKIALKNFLDLAVSMRKEYL